MTLPLAKLLRLVPIPELADLITSRLNREILAAHLLPPSQGGYGRCQLPADTYNLDKALWLDPRYSGCELIGSGSGTVLRQPHATSPYGDNCTLVAHDDAVGWYDQIVEWRGTSVLLDKHTAMQHYLPGRVCWAFKRQAYDGVYERYVINSVDGAGKRVWMDRPVDPSLFSLKWCAGFPIEDVAAGVDRVTLTDPASNRPAVGKTVYITGGPALVDECPGDYRRVVTVEGQVVHLDRPTSRFWGKAALVTGPFVENVTIQDLTVDQPAHGGANPCFMRGAVNLRMERVQFGTATTNFAAFAMCGSLSLRDCRPLGGLACNFSDGAELCGYRGRDIVCEEMSHGIYVADSHISANRGAHGIVFNHACTAGVIQGTTIEGFGYGGSPIAGLGDGFLIRDVTIRNCNPDGVMWFGGTGCRIDGLRSERPVQVSGQGWDIARSRCPNWALQSGSGGKIRADCEGEIVGAIDGWAIEKSVDVSDKATAGQ